MVKPKYEVEKRTQTTPFLVEYSVFLFENDQSAHEFQTPNRISPDLNVLFVRHFFQQKRHRQRVEQKRESTRVSAVSHSNWRTHWEPMRKIVTKAGNEFYVCGRACDVSNILQKFQSSPGYLAFFFAFDWLLALEFCLHPSHLSWTIRTALSHRVKKNWTPVIQTFHHPPKCEKCIVFCTDRSCCRTTKAKLRAKGRKLCIEIPTNHYLTTTFCCWRRKENSATFSTDYTNLHRHTLEKKNYININQRSKTVGKHFSFSTFRSTFVCAQASKQQQHTFFEFQTLSLTYKQKAKNAFKKTVTTLQSKTNKKTLKKSDTIKKTKKKRG